MSVLLMVVYERGCLWCHDSQYILIKWKETLTYEHLKPVSDTKYEKEGMNCTLQEWHNFAWIEIAIIFNDYEMNTIACWEPTTQCQPDWNNKKSVPPSETAESTRNGRSSVGLEPHSTHQAGAQVHFITTFIVAINFSALMFILQLLILECSYLPS
jgi:hypothetical protein